MVKTEQVFPKISRVCCHFNQSALVQFMKEIQKSSSFYNAIQHELGATKSGIQFTNSALTSLYHDCNTTQNIASICIKKQTHLNFIIHHITPNRFAKVMQTIASTKHQTTPLGMQLDCNYQV